MKKFIFMLSASLLLLAACSKDDDAVLRNGDRPVNYVTKSFNASCKGEKTAFVPGTKLKQGFQDGDKVFVYGVNYGVTYGRPGVVSSGVEWGEGIPFYSSAGFVVEVPDDETLFRAIMPYQASMTSGKLTLPTHQVADKGSNDRNANILYATTSNAGSNLSFQMACAYIRLRVKNNSKSATRLVIHSNEPVSGVCNYAFLDGNAFRLTGSVANGGDSVSLSSTEETGILDDTAYFAVILPTSEKSTVVYEMKDNEGRVLASCVVVNRKFEAGSVYTLTLDGDKLTATGEPISVPGLFSVSPTKKVAFSKGNLQYNASTDTWRFAENQWDFIGSLSQYIDDPSLREPEDYVNVASGNVIGSDNANIGKENYTGWIDLFGWGTGDAPTKHVVEDDEYVPSTHYLNFTDWGTNNKLKATLGSGWHTLDADEWYYLIDYSNESRRGKLGHATVNNVVGIVLLPDEWVLPEGCTFKDGYGNSWNTNSYDIDHWKKMEAAGAVFLPAAGDREGQDIFYVGGYGVYWTSTGYDDDFHSIFFNFDYGYFDDYAVFVIVYLSRFCGCSVRLVR